MQLNMFIVKQFQHKHKLRNLNLGTKFLKTEAQFHSLCIIQMGDEMGIRGSN
jgi:hypothetical protein